MAIAFIYVATLPSYEQKVRDELIKVPGAEILAQTSDGHILGKLTTDHLEEAQDLVDRLKEGCKNQILGLDFMPAIPTKNYAKEPPKKDSST